MYVAVNRRIVCTEENEELSQQSDMGMMDKLALNQHEKKLRGDDRVSSNKAVVSFCTFCRQILYLDTEKYLHSETSDARCSLGYTTYIYIMYIKSC